jgi:hypothetical protein
VLLLRGLVIIAILGVWLYSVFDVIRSEASAVHHLHKLVWLVFVLLIPLLGAPTWLLLGRPQPIGSRLFEPSRRAPIAPDDSPEFLSQIDDEIRRRRRAERLRAQNDDSEAIDDEIRRLEEELRRRSEEQPGEDPKI